MSPSESAAYVTVRTEEMGERFGLWCEHCSLPSRVDVELALFFDDHFSHVITFSCCMDCGRQDWS